MNPLKILVTGGAGYIGSLLVPSLLSKGFQVTVIDNFMYRQTSLLDCCHFPELTLISGDVRNKSLIKKHLVSSDIIIPLACLTGAPICEKKPNSARQINYNAIDYMLELKSKDQRILFPSTNSGYGVGQTGIYCTEKSPLTPVSLYGRLKVDMEKKLLDEGNAITFRFATLFGTSPRMRIDLLVNDFVYRAIYDRAIVLFESHFKRNYLHVRDAVAAFIFCIEHFEDMKNQAYNVGLDNANLSKKELCETIKKHLPLFEYVEAAIGHDPDQRNYIVSNDKVQKKGYKANYTLDQGIIELIKGYNIANPNMYRNYP
ncbi:UDP-glucose 4-epimerase [Candidatus Magnetomorum sp. HK-1]|nr:UDP-glucose 4-epimerase [Candidatus Magnetomorum sp. HK-1]